MKITLLYFSLFVFHSSLCVAQDTLVLKNGQKMAVKVIYVAPDIIYSIPPSDKQKLMWRSKVSYIKYSGGSIYTINTNANDSAWRKWKPYILVSGGLNKPWSFSGYGASSYYSNYDGYGYSGYASNGSDFSLTGGIKNYRGWELTGSFSYIRNQLDASGYMTETIADFFLSPNNIGHLNNVNAIGSYYYNNYALLAGITKSWGRAPNVSFGISLLFGDFITYTPALYGIASGYSYNGTNSVSDYFNMNSETQGNFIAEFGLHLDIPIEKHFFLRFLAEFQFSGLKNGGGYQYVDITSGNTIYSGTYSGGANGFNYSSFFVGLTDLTAGVGYKF
jgi:hypothetical protein